MYSFVKNADLCLLYGTFNNKPVQYLECFFDSKDNVHQTSYGTNYKCLCIGVVQGNQVVSLVKDFKDPVSGQNTSFIYQLKQHQVDQIEGRFFRVIIDCAVKEYQTKKYHAVVINQCSKQQEKNLNLQELSKQDVAEFNFVYGADVI